MPDDSPIFNNLLMSSINHSLESVLGTDTAKSLVFYLDTNIAVANPGHYARSLERVLGAAGAAPLLDKIINDLSSRIGIPRVEGKTFKDIVADMRESFQRTSQTGHGPSA
jgi:hypothetical protein